MPKLCLNMIVRNESARIIRALDSVKDVISTYAILDTGSTDNTIELIEEWGAKHHIHGIVGRGAFVNFSQARNQALDLARSWHQLPSCPWFDYMLLMDADMELVVEVPAIAFNGLTHEAYHMVQKAGGVSYNNLRLLSVVSHAKYVGVTHEYLAVNAAGVLAGAHFVDHADGANRKDKSERDIRLFEEDLKTDPNNGRTWFYLANSYRDAGDVVAAERCYRRKLSLPTWPEEDWMAQINLANCLEQQKLEDAYLTETLKAYQMRPCRAEPLHALAKHHRVKGENALAMLFAEKGISIPRPADLLFVEDWVYDWGFREEYSIAGFYQDDTRDKAFEITNGLALDPKVPDHVRNGARSNMVFYLRKLEDLAPSYQEQEINFTPNAGFTAMNPCVTGRPDGSLEVLLRTVNYTINEHGQYMIGPKGCWDAPIETENFLLQLGPDLRTRDYTKVFWERPAPKFNMVIGLEDMRIFWHKGERQFVACAREQNEAGTPEQWHGYLRIDADDYLQAEDAKRISDPVHCEKNWSPIRMGPHLFFMYRVDQMEKQSERVKLRCAQAVDNISGGSPYIPWRQGYLSVVHEAVVHPSHGRRIYQHRFVWLDSSASRPRFSMPFVFREVQIEFAAGIALNTHNGQLVVSFGEKDAKAWLCSVSQDDVAAMLGLDR
jgi:glycosyltransferase involved in cell wall biosynthesis